MESDQFEYTSSHIRAMLNCLSQLEAAAQKGTLTVSPASYRTKSFEEKIENADLQSLTPAPSRRRNQPYHIDTVGALWVDLNRALDNAIVKRDKKRIILHYSWGYEYSEIAEAEGCSEDVVKQSVKRAIEKMTDYLNTPHVTDTSVYRPREGETYRRTYVSSPLMSHG